MRDFGEAPPPLTLFERLKEGLSRSTAGLSDSITGIFTNRKLDATTIVELWSSELTGVGPAIASGNQVCSGNWPDLPMQAMNSATPHQRSAVLVPVPDSAQPEMARTENPSLPSLSCAYAFELK